LGSASVKVMLCPDFEAKSREKLRLLLQQRAAADPGAAVAPLAVQPEPTASPEPAAVAAAIEASAVVVAEAPDDLVVNEKLVKLTDFGGRKTVLKDPPASLELVASEEDLPKFSLDALKKLAKSAGLDHSKQINKPTLVALLADAHRKAKAEAGGAEAEAWNEVEVEAAHDEEAAACFR